MLLQIKNDGFGIIEIIIAVAMFVILLFGGTIFLTQGFNLNRLSDQEVEATYYSSEGLEVARSISNQDWDNMEVGNVNCNGVLSKGVTNTGTTWSWTTTPAQMRDNFTRTITIENVCRNSSGNIDTAGTIYDKNLKKITSTVNWSFSPTRNNTIALSTYLSNYELSILGDWSHVSIGSTLNLTGNQNALRVSGSGNYAYIIRPGASPNFLAINASASPPAVVGSLNLVGNPTDISVSGNYAYVTNENDSADLQIIDITTPSSPTLIRSYDLSGTSNPTSIYINGTTAYITKRNSGSPEFYIINISNPTNPTTTGSLNLNGDAVAVSTTENYATVASTYDLSELIVVNISNPSTPSQLGTYDIGGNIDPTTVNALGNYVFVGKMDGSMTVVNIIFPIFPFYANTYGGAGGAIYDSSMGNNNNYMYLATSAPTREFQVADVTNVFGLSMMSTINLGIPLNGVFYDANNDRVYAVSQSDTSEFMIIVPQ